MSRFFVVHGYCGPDNFTSNNGPILEVKEFGTAEEVERYYTEWREYCGLDRSREKSQVTFRVIEGTERRLTPEEKVTRFKLT